MNITRFVFAFCALLLSSCATSGGANDLYETIRYDTFLYFCGVRRYTPPTNVAYEEFKVEYRFGEYRGYHVYNISTGPGCGHGWFHEARDYDVPVAYDDGLVVELVLQTSYPNYFVWKDHRVWTLDYAYRLDLLTKEDMEKVSAKAHEINETLEVQPCYVSQD